MGFRSALVLLLALPAFASAFSFGAGPTALGLRSSPPLQLHRHANANKRISHLCTSLRMQEQKEETSDSGNSVDQALGNSVDQSFMSSKADADFPDMVPVESINPAFFVIGGVIGCVPLAILLIETCKVSIGFVPDQCRGLM